MTEQLALIEGDSEEALLLSAEHLKQKRYTAGVVQKIEMKRDWILDLLAMGLPVERIAEKVHCSSRIVNILGAKFAQQVSANAMDIVRVLRAKAMKCAFYADDKMPGAKLGELGVFMGISLQRASEMEMIAQGAGAIEDPAIDLEQENEALRSARAFLELKRANEPKPAEVVA